MTTLPRRAMGRLLRELRVRADSTQLAASRILEISKQGVGRLEDGQSIRMTTAQLKELLDYYDADEQSRAEVLQLWSEVKEARLQTSGRQGAWWKAYADTFAANFDHYLALEEAADQVTTFQLTLLPGLLQTAGYRRAVIHTSSPGISAVDTERRIELVMRRQARLREDADSFKLNVLLSELALRLPIGTLEVREEQLRHLAEIGRLPNVSIRVIPLGVADYPGLVIGSFSLLAFPLQESTRLNEPPMVFVDGHEGALFLDDEGAIVRYQAALADMATLALDEQESGNLILDIAENLR